MFMPLCVAPPTFSHFLFEQEVGKSVTSSTKHKRTVLINISDS